MRPFFIDLHEDISLYYASAGAGLRFPPADLAEDLRGRHADIPKYEKANARIVFAAIAPMTHTIDPELERVLSRNYRYSASVIRFRAPFVASMEHFLIYYGLVGEHPRRLKMIERRADATMPPHGVTGLVLSMEGAEPFESVADQELFYRLGLRSFHLTWNYDNRYSASCMSSKDYGLTGDGERLVVKANELGVVVDLAHSSRRASLEAMRLSRLPVMVSHANASAVHRHARNVDDSVLEALKRNGGVIGFTLIPTTISSKPSIGELAKHIMYAYERFGPDILGIGTDYFGIHNVREPAGLEDISRIGQLWDLLRRLGMSERDVEKVAYRNAMRVLRKNAAKWAK